MQSKDSATNHDHFKNIFSKHSVLSVLPRTALMQHATDNHSSAQPQARATPLPPPATSMLLQLTSYRQNLMALPSCCSFSNCAKCSFQGQPATGSLMMAPVGSTPNRPLMASCTRALAGIQLCSTMSAFKPDDCSTSVTLPDRFQARNASTALKPFNSISLPN